MRRCDSARTVSRRSSGDRLTVVRRAWCAGGCSSQGSERDAGLAAKARNQLDLDGDPERKLRESNRRTSVTAPITEDFEQHVDGDGAGEVRHNVASDQGAAAYAGGGATCTTSDGYLAVGRNIYAPAYSSSVARKCTVTSGKSAFGLSISAARCSRRGGSSTWTHPSAASPPGSTRTPIDNL